MTDPSDVIDRLSERPGRARLELRHKPFWQELAPGLTVAAGRGLSGPDIHMDTGVLGAASERLSGEGYLHLSPVVGASDLQPVIDGINRLRAQGLPPVFIYMYDQPWALFRRLRPLISHFLGSHYYLLPNFWAWCLDLHEGAAGWPVHRDCSGETRFANPDGGQTLMSLSLWIPLTDATPDNGCMYVLPRSREQPQSGDDIHKTHGLALPARAGSVLGWTQDLYHWSGAVTARARTPRISLSLEFQSAHFAAMAEPLLDISSPPEFPERLALIAGQIDKYRHMEEPDLAPPSGVTPLSASLAPARPCD